MSEASDPKAVDVRLANSQVFCQAVLDDIEGIFRERYGPKWTPLQQQLFQRLREACYEAARSVDSGVARDAIRPLQHIVQLTNYPDGR